MYLLRFCFCFTFHLQVNLLRMGPYGGVDDTMGFRVHSEPSIKAYNPFEDPDFNSKRDTLSGINSSVPDINNERPISKSSHDALPISADDSNVLFVGGLPKDCTRREVGRILFAHTTACRHWLSVFDPQVCLVDRKKLF